MTPSAVPWPGETVLAGPRRFAAEWLAAEGKSVVPVVAPSGVDEALLDRLRAGARFVGADEVLRCGLEPGSVVERLAVDSALLAGASVLFVMPDLSGAVLASGGGYVLVAGTPLFLSGAVPGGVDGARARFGRTARRLAERYPELPGVAAEYRPVEHAWAKPSEVRADSWVARELAVMESFVRGELSGSEFSRAWGTAWRLANERGERLRTPFELVLDHVFFVLEDYPIDPTLRDPGDVTDEELHAEVRAALRRLAAMDGYSARGHGGVKLCCRTGGLSAAAGFETLTAGLLVENRHHGEDWVSADVGCHLEFSVITPLVSDEYVETAMKTVPGEPSVRAAGADALVTLTVTRDDEWPAVTAVWRAAKSLWDVVPYDDGSGFEVDLEEL